MLSDPNTLVVKSGIPTRLYLPTEKQLTGAQRSSLATVGDTLLVLWELRYLV